MNRPKCHGQVEQDRETTIVVECSTCGRRFWRAEGANCTQSCDESKGAVRAFRVKADAMRELYQEAASIPVEVREYFLESEIGPDPAWDFEEWLETAESNAIDDGRRAEAELGARREASGGR